MSGLPSFRDFFAAVHGYDPFPWQTRLAEEVLTEGWPDVLDLPTGAGKTSAIDVSLYCLACAPQRMPRRTVLVVDRRIVVDQGAEHARKLLRAMRETTRGPVADIASALRATFWGASKASDPFAVAVLRGGMPRDNDWARRPDQPVVGLSTVDQLGSRLLFRGYGISPRSASIHAGLLGNDVLILLDEVHLALPFAETLGAIGDRFRPGESPLPQRFKVVRMSATVGAVDERSRTFSLAQADREHPVLSMRLTASKPARLVTVKVKGDNEREKLAVLAREAAVQALGLLNNARIVAVVVNRVDTARLIHELLTSKHQQTTDCELLTGRMRPVERDQFVRDVLLRRVAARQARRDHEKPLILVATQCIEAGADLDFDALVTECASLDALRQRFGRLDRQGLRRRSLAVILGRSDAVAKDADDPIYGTGLSACWNWLQGVASDDTVDFGITALPACLGSDGAPRLDVLAPTSPAPVLLPAHLDAWAQTTPRPAIDPDIDLWLHGPNRSAVDVQLVWRSDIRLPRPAEVDAVTADTIQALSSRRPSSLEAITLPLAVARQWLADTGPTSPIADVTATRSTEEDSGRPRTGAQDQEEIVAFRWEGADSAFVRPNELRPGDVIVVPLARGGIHARNFDPTSATPVLDVGDLAQLRGRAIASLFLNEEALRLWSVPEIARHAPAPIEEESTPDARARISDWIATWPAEPPPDTLAVLAEWEALRATFALGRRYQLKVSPGGFVLWAPVPKGKLDRSAGTAEIGESLTEDDDSSFRDGEVTLAAHSRDVRQIAEEFARALGLSPELVGALGLAAWLHDVGKADPRFQRWLAGGCDIRAASFAEPLAKSALAAGNAAARQAARERARYPAGFRHELLSLAMIEASIGADESAPHRELVLHLVASHHGWCRPFAPLLDHAEDFEVSLQHGGAMLRGRTRHGKARLDSGVADRFWSLTTQYGWWGLAWLEAILRLADHRASEMAEARQ